MSQPPPPQPGATEQAGLPLTGGGFIAKTQKICQQRTSSKLSSHTRNVFQANNRNYRINMKTTQPGFQAAYKTISLHGRSCKPGDAIEFSKKIKTSFTGTYFRSAFCRSKEKNRILKIGFV